MDRSTLSMPFSPLWVIVCLLVGGIYAFLLYHKKGPWNKRTNVILAVLRFLSVSTICILLLDILLRQVKNTIESPIVVLAIDNSSSIRSNTDSTSRMKLMNDLQQLSTQLTKEGKIVEYEFFDKNHSKDSVTFEYPTSNLDALIQQLKSKREGRNLSSTVLISDGIYNSGISPAYGKYGIPIHTVGIGDTTTKEDLVLYAIGHNKIAYLNNDFPIKAEVKNIGFVGESVEVLLKNKGKIIDKKTIKVSKDNQINEVVFYASSKQAGLQHFVVEVKNKEGEFTFSNNQQHAYIDVLDSKEKVLIVAMAPHPDIKAIKRVLELKSTLEITTHIVMLEENKIPQGKFDLIIYHQLPNIKGIGRNLISQLHQTDASELYIIGNQTNFSEFNTLNGNVNIIVRQGKTDEVTPFLNTKFQKFKLEEGSSKTVLDYPPVFVPFGDFKVKGGVDVLMKQRLGTLETEKPLITVNTKASKKTGVILGDGIWRWRMYEGRDKKETVVFDDIIQKLVTLLSEKNDKRKFRVSTPKNEFIQGEKVRFIAEAYNEIYEEVYNYQVSLQLKNEQEQVKKYKFSVNESSNTFSLNTLEAGIYTYTATAKINGKLERYTSEFVVKKLNRELLNVQADFELLRKISKNNKGKFFNANDITSIYQSLQGEKTKDMVYSDEEEFKLIEFKWIFFFILFLFTAEWSIRKAMGGY